MAYKRGVTKVYTAAKSANELAMLKGIAADLCNPLPKLVYADWLEEQDDPRTDFIREFVQNASSPDEDLPSSDEYPLAWRHVIGAWALELIRDQDAKEIENDLLRLAQPMLNIDVVPIADDQIPIGETKFGGFPDLPHGMAWPMEEDQPHVFCGQVRLSDLRGTLAAAWLPEKGNLSFFTSMGSKALVYHFAAGEAFRRVPPPVTDAWYKEYLPMPSATMRVHETLDLPTQRSLIGDLYDRIGYNSLSEIAYELRQDRDGERYPHFILGYRGGAFNGVEQDPKMRHLMHFGNVGSLNLRWPGDMGGIYFSLPVDDLVAGRFDRVEGDFG